ncbi:conjugal transfer protein TraG N-terminal domain-containing protein [Pasteurella skyensis]|uniref:conjugal transfer protein TraG N-terminal domain-containing protein n=1 Tax=Phocoenobacter skyensis TaxID=97481 RepID=UPI00275FD21B|nr:conjugal transfer protein TraG N-terminal domain-containing protein [Pasteurella skyensis]MDP8189063.1 conjugal transfer protein TraG N-terminal domain-containing protein [Pasteurella skyensis]
MNSITLTVDSYYEYFLTMLGWVINNGIWDLFTQTGLFAAPFLAHIINLFLKVREQGDDEGNKGRLLASWLENKLYVSLIVMIFTCLPVFTASYSSLQFNEKRMDTCGVTVLKPSQTELANLSSELNGQTADIPLWWAFTYSVGKGFTHGAIALLPCKPDLRQIRFEVQNTQITNPALRQEINDFVKQCFVPARTKFKRYQDQFNVNEALARDIDWIGSSVFLNTGGLYDSFYAQNANPYFPYNPTRDIGRPSGLGGGFPSCKEWWSTNRVGLKARVMSQIEPSTLTKIQKIWTDSRVYEDGIIRQLVSPQNIANSEGSRYRGYNDGIIGSESFTSIIGSMGASVGQMFTAPAFDIVRQSLPMIQGFTSLAIIIGLPIIMVMSGYSITAMVTVGVIQISVFFLSFWWELARWFDWWFLKSIEDDGYDWGLFFIGSDDVVLKIVINIMFLVLPTLWFLIMGWAGFKGGDAIGKFIDKSGDKNQRIAQKGQDTATK